MIKKLVADVTSKYTHTIKWFRIAETPKRKIGLGHGCDK